MSVVGGRIAGTTADFLPELRLGLDNLRAHKLRSLLTMLGMIFGVAAVVAMLSIGAGAQQEVMAFIEQLGVRNLIVEAREASNWQALQKVRKISPGLTFQDLPRHPGQPRRHHGVDGAQALHAGEAAAEAAGRRRRSSTASSTGYMAIANLQVVSGRFFDEAENASRRAASRCSARRPRRRSSAPTIRSAAT